MSTSAPPSFIRVKDTLFKREDVTSINITGQAPTSMVAIRVHMSHYGRLSYNDFLFESKEEAEAELVRIQKQG